MTRITPLQQQARALILERKALAADLAEAKLRLLDGEAAETLAAVKALEDRDLELAAMQRNVAAELAMHETTILGAC